MSFASNKKKVKKKMPVQKSSKTLKGTKLKGKNAGTNTYGKISTLMGNVGKGPMRAGWK